MSRHPILEATTEVPYVTARGTVLNFGASSSYVPIPSKAAGGRPRRVRLAATASCYVRLGADLGATAVEAAAGTGYVPQDEITLTGGTFNRAMTLRVDSTELISAAISAIGAGYAVDDVLTLAGGQQATSPTVTVATIQLASAALNAAGTGYAPGNVATLASGTFTTAATVTVATTKVVSATVAVGGADGTDGAGVIVEGTTGTGTKFRASVTVTAGAIASIQSITVGGAYTVNPTDIANEPVTAVTGGAGLTGAELTVVMGVDTFTITNRGNYTVGSATFTQNGATTPAGGTGMTLQTGSFGVRTFTVTTGGEFVENADLLTQSGDAAPAGGAGATFDTLVYGVESVSVVDGGDYTADPANPVSQGSTTGVGEHATFTVTMASAAAAGDLLLGVNQSIILDAYECDHVAAIQVSAPGVLQISPIE
jgi:hypothetical protein